MALPRVKTYLTNHSERKSRRPGRQLIDIGLADMAENSIGSLGIYTSEHRTLARETLPVLTQSLLAYRIPSNSSFRVLRDYGARTLQDTSSGVRSLFLKER